MRPNADPSALGPASGSKFGFRHDFRFNAAEANPQFLPKSNQLLQEGCCPSSIGSRGENRATQSSLSVTMRRQP
jgi:hypothetical protein